MKNNPQTELDNLLYNIKWLRQHNGLSKKQMTDILGVSLKTLNKIERGEMPPRLGASVLYNISVHFGISSSKQFEKKLSENIN